MLTTDRLRDSELLGRLGSRGYYSNTHEPHVVTRVVSARGEDEFVVERTSAFSFDSDSRTGKLPIFSGEMRDLEPSTDRQEKETTPMPPRCQMEPRPTQSLVNRSEFDDKGD